MKYTSARGVDLRSEDWLDREPRCLRNGDTIVATKVTRAPTPQEVKPEPKPPPPSDTVAQVDEETSRRDAFTKERIPSHPPN